MKFKDFGNSSLPVIILLHGGGLSWWSLENIIEDLKKDFYVVTPIIDGHGEASDSTFISIEDSAKKLIKYIDDKYNGKVYALGGLSIGAQIALEVLSKREDIAKYAFIESGLVYPIKGTKTLTVPMVKMSYPLISKRWFSRFQAKSLFVPENMFERYYEDSNKISKDSLVNISLSNGNFKLKDSIKNTRAKVLIIVGSKELKIMKKSALKIHEMINESTLYTAPDMGHGEISLKFYKNYIKLIRSFMLK